MSIDADGELRKALQPGHGQAGEDRAPPTAASMPICPGSARSAWPMPAWAICCASTPNGCASWWSAICCTPAARAPSSILDNWDASLAQVRQGDADGLCQGAGRHEGARAPSPWRQSRDMGKITGFLEIERQDRGYEKPEARLNNYSEFVHPLPYAEVSQAGGALHGLRHSLLSPGLPGQQPDPGLEQSGLSRPVAHRVRERCTPPTISRNSPAASAPRPARRAAP